MTVSNRVVLYHLFKYVVVAIVVKFAKSLYSVTEGSGVSITVVVGRRTNRKFTVVLTTVANSSSGRNVLCVFQISNFTYSYNS